MRIAPRSLALLAGLAVIAGALAPVAPAFADETPPPSPQPSPAETAPPAIDAPPASADTAAAIPFPGGGFSVTLGTPLQAVPSGWVSPAPTFTYRWYRDSSPIAGTLGDDSTYQLTAADNNRDVWVKVTATKAGYTTKVVNTTPVDYTVLAFGGSSSTIAGTAAVGQVLTGGVANGLYSYNGSSIPASTISYQWYRDGVAVTADPDGRYTLTGSDYNRRMTVRAIVGFVGHPPVTLPFSAPTAPVLKGSIVVHPEALSVGSTSAEGAGLVLTASVFSGAVTAPAQSAVTISYQWLRVTRGTFVETPISGATKSKFTVTAAYAPYLIGVRAVVSAPGYNPVTLQGPRRDATLVESHGPGLVGSAVVGVTLTAQPGTYTGNGLAVTPDSVTVQWLRNGVAVGAAQTGPTFTYLVKPTDVGTTLGYRVTTRKVFYLPVVQTLTVPPGKVVAADLPYTPSTPTVTPVDISTHSGLRLDAHDPTTNAAFTPFGPAALRIQWLRDGKPIAGATSATYYPSEKLDSGHLIAVRFAYSKAGYKTKTLASVGTDYGFYGSDPVLQGEVAYDVPGATLSVKPRTFSRLGVPTQKYQWYRNGVPIAIPLGGGAFEFALSSDDKGKTISVRIVAKLPGLMVNTETSAATQPVGAHSIFGWDYPAPGTVEVGIATPGTETLIATGLKPCGTCVMKYQWYRSGAAIAGATRQTYALVAADRGHGISVRVITSKAADVTGTYTTNVRFSPRKDWTLYDVGGSSIATTVGLRVGGVVSVDVGAVADASGVPNDFPVESTFQWYRTVGSKRTAIPESQGGRIGEYNIKAADVGAKLSVVVTTRKESGGLIPLVRTLVPSPNGTVTKGVFAVSGPPTIGQTAGSAVLTANLPASVYPTPTAKAYRWYLSGKAISGATKPTYTVPSNTRGVITVRVSISATGYATLALPSSPGIEFGSM